MSKILLKGRPYGGSTTVTDALHLLTKDTLNADVSAQNMISNILGDMAQLETSTAATKAYAKGEYLVLGSYFYKVTATIDPGDTLTVGTNIERTNVGAEVSELNSKTIYKTISKTITRGANSGYSNEEITYVHPSGYSIKSVTVELASSEYLQPFLCAVTNGKIICAIKNAHSVSLERILYLYLTLSK